MRTVCIGLAPTGYASREAHRFPMTAKRKENPAMKLSNANLSMLPAPIAVPSYDRHSLTAGIVHIGVGNFHRGHQAWYVHRLMQMGLAQDWAIIGAGVMPGDAVMRDKLVAQDCLTTLIELDPNGTGTEVIGSMIDFLPVENGHAALIAAMAAPNIRIVSLTVTEGGYYIDPATKGFDAGHADMVHDAQSGAQPKTAFGAIIAALKLRRSRGLTPFTCLSCDNLQGNGHVLRQTVVSLARLSDPDLADWIDAHCRFPNSMVDCIVPATGGKEIALAQSLGVEDRAPVTHENYRQWVIEDAFCAGRPALENVGVTFADDVHPYEAMKIRLLNGGHQVISVPAQILGIDTIAECMTHDLVRGFFEKVAGDEIAPHVATVPGITPETYVASVAHRFSNPRIHDTTRRVAFDGSSRHPGFILPTLRDALDADAPIEGLALLEALWARMCAGMREDGAEIAPNDPLWGTLVETAQRAKATPQAWLDMHQIYGDLAQNSRFSTAFARWLELIWAEGVEAALGAYLDQC